MLKIENNAKWIQEGITVAGTIEKGKGLNQLNSPNGLYIDHNDQTIYIADHCNDRIVAWKEGTTTGQVVAGGKKLWNWNDQLNRPIDAIFDKDSDSLIICDAGNRRVVQCPRQNGAQGQTIISDINCYGVTMSNSGYIYVSDTGKHEVRRWKIGESNGTVVAGGNGEGNRLDQLSYPTFISVDHSESLYITDYNNHRVMEWAKGAKEGVVVAGGRGQGSSLAQLSHPGQVAVDQLDTVYVTDYKNRRVVRWFKGATQGKVILSESSSEDDANRSFNPSGLTLDRLGNLYVANGHRVQKFSIDLS